MRKKPTLSDDNLMWICTCRECDIIYFVPTAANSNYHHKEEVDRLGNKTLIPINRNPINETPFQDLCSSCLEDKRVVGYLKFMLNDENEKKLPETISEFIDKLGKILSQNVRENKDESKNSGIYKRE